jgi:hypothetical protein
MGKHYIQIAHAALTSAQLAPDAVDITSFTRGIYALLSPAPTFWRVIGVTESALSILRESMEVRRLPKGLERAHIRQRSETVKMLLFGPRLSVEEFEEAILGDADHTVLCAKGENNNQLTERDDIRWIDNGNSGEDPLFQPLGFAARWSDAEKNFVRLLDEPDTELEFVGSNGEKISFAEIAKELPKAYDNLDSNGLPSLNDRAVISEDMKLYDLFQIIEISLEDADRRNMEGPGWYWVTYFADPSTGCAHIGPFQSDREALEDASSKSLPMNDPRRGEYKLGLIGADKVKLQFIVGKFPE